MSCRLNKEGADSPSAGFSNAFGSAGKFSAFRLKNQPFS
jgi:hypothetical protein